MSERLRPTPSLPPRFEWPGAVRFTILVTLGALIIASFAFVAPSPERLASGIPRMINLVGRMLPPDLEPGFMLRMSVRIAETLAIALAGTVIGIIVSVPVAWFAARGLSPLQGFEFVAKGAISFLRTVPDLVWALIFVVSIGLGPVAGTMTIVIDTIGFCGRFFAEAMEDAEKGPQEALRTIGASRFSILAGAIIPDIMPSMVNTSLYALEKAVRSSVVLGLVGAGGIGQELEVAFSLFQYQRASTIILAIFIVVIAMEFVTDRLRARID